MSLTEIINKYYVDGKFTYPFSQSFADASGKVNFREFNRYFETKASFAQINNEILAVSGSKLIPFEKREDTAAGLRVFGEAYQFGKFTHPRDWVMHMADNYGVEISLAAVFKFVANQRPERSTSSFLPASMQDHKIYDKEDKPI